MNEEKTWWEEGRDSAMMLGLVLVYLAVLFAAVVGLVLWWQL
jgi:hypothetical protein